MAKTKQTKVKHYTKRDCMAFAYLAPWIIGMLVLQLYPFLSSLAYSFCNYKITGTPQFAGWTMSSGTPSRSRWSTRCIPYPASWSWHWLLRFF